MSDNSKTYIAGKKTPDDWYRLRERLSVGTPYGWREAFTGYFETRLNLRYLHPIKVLQEHGTSRGEGFSIVAIQCSLIEFLESTAQGTNYRHIRKGDALSEHEYSSSQNVFVAFLTRRAPFSGTFNELSAQDFYVSVRCGLLHEARTKNGWRIRAQHVQDTIAAPAKRIVYRNNFQSALLSYIHAYGEQLPQDAQLQEAFIRKFDHLCK
jgi:hypothetical protein